MSCGIQRKFPLNEKRHRENYSHIWDIRLWDYFRLISNFLFKRDNEAFRYICNSDKIMMLAINIFFCWSTCLYSFFFFNAARLLLFFWYFVHNNKNIFLTKSLFFDCLTVFLLHPPLPTEMWDYGVGVGVLGGGGGMSGGGLGGVCGVARHTLYV